MVYRRPCLRGLFNSISATNHMLAWFVIVLLTPSLFGQEQSQQGTAPEGVQPQPQARNANITLPAGTHLALVLTQPVQTRYTRRGDDVYAQVTSPVDAENQVVIPPGTFVQGTVDKIERNGGRGELRLQSMAITFPDGYVTPISGPITLETTDRVCGQGSGIEARDRSDHSSDRGRGPGCTDRAFRWKFGIHSHLERSPGL